MARDTAKVLMGAGYFYTAPDGEAAPTIGVGDVYTDAPGGGYVDIGYSEEGWNLLADTTYEYFTPAEEVDPIATAKTAQEIRVRGVAAQFELPNIKIALGGGTIVSAAGPPATDTYTPPAGDAFDFFTVLFRTKSVQGTAPGLRDWHFPRTISVASVDAPHRKGANPATTAVEMRAIKVTGSDVFTVVETT